MSSSLYHNSLYAYLPYDVFTEELCYAAITHMINEAIQESKSPLHRYSPNEIRKNLTFDLNDCDNWIIQFIDDARYHIHRNQSEERIYKTDTEKIVGAMSKCLAKSKAGQQILEKFIYNQHRDCRNFVTSYYDRSDQNTCACADDFASLSF